MLENLVDYNDRNNTPLSNEKLQQAVSKVMPETEEEYDAESDPNSNPKVATHTSGRNKRKVTDTETPNINYPRKLLINPLTPEIIPVAIPPIDQTIVEDAAGSGETLHARCTIISKEIFIDAARSSAHFPVILRT